MWAYLSMILFNVGTGVALLTVVLFLYFKYNYGYWKRRNVPYLKPTIPFGNVLKLIKFKLNFGEYFAEVYSEAKKRGNRFIGIYFLFQPNIVLCDLSIIKSVLIENFKTFPGRGLYYYDKIDPMTSTLFHSSGPIWKLSRAKTSSMFTTHKLKTVSNLFCKSSEELENVILGYSSKSLPIDIKEVINRSIINNIGRTVFGLEYNSFNSNPELLEKSKYVIDRIYANPKSWALPILFPGLINFFKIPFFEKHVSEFYYNLFKDTVNILKNSGNERRGLMDEYVHASKKDVIEVSNRDDLENDNFANKQLSMDLMAAHAFGFLVGGWETSASTITFSMLNLVQNLHIQEKLREEISRVLKDYNNTITYDAVMKMEYLDCVVKETLRIYPPIPVLHRKCEARFNIPGTDIVLEPGTMVWISLLGMHRDPELYPEPEKFNPERFYKEINNDAYLPFGCGPKICIGARLGTLQVKFALVTLLKEHKYTLVDKNFDTSFATQGLTLSLRNPLILNAEKV